MTLQDLARKVQDQSEKRGQMMEGIEDLQYLADFTDTQSLRLYQVNHWILVRPVPPEVTLGLVAGLISAPNGKNQSPEEIERRGKMFLSLIETERVRVFPTLLELEAAAGTDSFRVIFLGNTFVLEACG